MISYTILRCMTRANVYTMTSLCSVSSVWWQTLTRRTFIGRVPRQNFTHACHSFKCTPHKLETLTAGTGSHVWGVAEMSDKLYAVCSRSSAIEVFANSPSYGRLDDIKVEHLKDPTHVVGRDGADLLYVADFATSCIWQVTLQTVNKIGLSKFISMPCKPYSLSMKSERLLVTPNFENL